METNRNAQRRCDVLKDAISNVLTRTLQSNEAGASLEKAFPNYSFAEEMGTTDSFLASLTRIATDSALTRVDDWLSQDNIKRTMDTIDEQYISGVMPQNDSMDVQTPMTSLPSARLADLTVLCKSRELEKLRNSLEEKEQAASELQVQLHAQAQDAGTLRSKLSSFSQNAEEAFQIASKIKA